MTKVADVVKAMSDFAPTELAEEWDNVGLLVGSADRNIARIIVMLDLDENGVREAIDIGADMIITHHPFIMQKISSVTDPLILKLAENRISVCSMHTNLDCAENGVNQVLAETIGLYDIEKTDFDGFITRSGYIDECSLGEFILNVKQSLDIDNLRYVGDTNTSVRKVCVLGGSGGDFIPAAKASGADVFLTSDIKYHQAQLADRLGLCIIDAGHFETENPIIYRVARYLREVFNDVDVITSLRTKSYIKYE